MKNRIKLVCLFIFTLASIVLLFQVEPISQNPAFHNFPDQRTLFGIPNGWNVLSNIPFVIIGIYGMYKVFYLNNHKHDIPTIISVILCIGILLTGFGSAYYHWQPDNQTLVWDRMPMTIIFMSFLCATIAERIDPRAGQLLVVPLVLIGILTVLYWQRTELAGVGDLRWYLLIQFYPIIMIPLIILLYPVQNGKSTSRLFVLIVVWYVIAKLFEHFDGDIYSSVQIISGHSLKHLAAAISTFYIVQLMTSSNFKRHYIF